MRSVINWETAHAVGTLMLGIGMMFAYAWRGQGKGRRPVRVPVRPGKALNLKR